MLFRIVNIELIWDCFRTVNGFPQVSLILLIQLRQHEGKKAKLFGDGSKSMFDVAQRIDCRGDGG